MFVVLLLPSIITRSSLRIALCVFSNVFCITTTIPKKLWRCVKSKFKKQNAIIWKWTVLTTVVISLIQSDWQTTSCLCLWVTDPFEDACFLNNEPVYLWNVADRCFGGVLQLSQPFVAPVLTCWCWGKKLNILSVFNSFVSTDLKKKKRSHCFIYVTQIILSFLESVVHSSVVRKCIHKYLSCINSQIIISRLDCL